MPALDTNVLVRYLVQDDEAQFGAAKHLLTQVVASGATLYVPVTVLLELEWVLRSSYRCPKAQVVQTMSDLLSAAELSFESEQAVEEGLHIYREGSADFADCLHVALASQAGEAPLWTFDRRAAELAGARLISR